MASKEKAYLLALSLPKMPVTVDQLQAFIKNNRIITGWWNHVPQVYVIRSGADLDALTDMFTEFFGTKNADFFIAKLDPEATQGFLPQKAWDSFDEAIEGPLKASTEST